MNEGDPKIKKKPLENAIMGGRNGSTARTNPNLSVLPQIK